MPWCLSKERTSSIAYEILGKLNKSLEVWRALGEKHDIDLFCGLFMKKANEGVELSAESMAALSQRGITLGLDIYSPTREELEATGCAA